MDRDVATAARFRIAPQPAQRSNERPPRDGAAEARLARAQELVGAVFTQPKELRHLTEQLFGELFVPTEVLADSPHSAIIALRPNGLGTLVIHAERARHWFPFRVTRVETGPSDGGAWRDAPPPARLRIPYGFRTPTRPRIDWL